MIRHRNIRDALLDAELDELRGIGEGAVARAVRSDALVRADAQEILRATSAMHDALDALAGRRAASAAATTGRPSGRRALTTVGKRRRQPRRLMPARPHRFRPRIWIGAGSLAAAALVALLLFDSVSLRTTEDATAPDPPLTATLDAESDQPFGVFATDNPDIAIVWLFPREVE